MNSAQAQTRRTIRGFSLVELMIGIVILGLGLVMVATMFPVAWQRARQLSEYTAQKSITASAEASIVSILSVSSPKKNHSSFMGDPIYSNAFTGTNYTDPIQACPGWSGDHWVHALNMGNILAEGGNFIAEDPWRLQDPNAELNQFEIELTGNDVIEQSFFREQLSSTQRLFPPMRSRKEVDLNTGVIFGPDESWDRELDTHRFLLGVLHRMHQPLTAVPQPTPPPSLSASRLMDLYFVTLRRPNPTSRYARQSPISSSTPDPCNLQAGLFNPIPLPSDEDVILPTPWRVQVEFPDTLVLGKPLLPDDPNLTTGIPTEITVPPEGAPGSTEQRAMIVGMFARRTQFIDEITGQVFKVIKRRLTTPEGDQAILTLQREVVIEDLNLIVSDPRCNPNDIDFLVPCELIRTVWVYPPPAQPRDQGQSFLIFDGSPPVVGIEVRSFTLAP